MPQESIILFPDVTAAVDSNGYIVSNDMTFVPTSNDPQFYLTMPEQAISSMRISFEKPLTNDTSLQVFYSKGSRGWTESDSVSQVILNGDSEIIIDMPSGKYDKLRFDIDGEFQLKEIDISQRDVIRELSVETHRSTSIMVFAATVVLTIFLAVVYSTSEPKEALKELAVIFIVYSFACFLAVQLLSDCAPDEYIRDDIPLWIFHNRRLPVGNEEELIANPWGFSYGFLPYLPSVLSIPLMCLFYAIEPTEASLLLAARFISVYSVVGCAVLCLKIGKIIFEKRASVYLFLALICFLPQVTFVGAYHNNDSFALFACLLVIYGLLKGQQARWNGKSCMFIAAAFACCVLSYYNSAGWILLSIPYCIVDVCRDKTLTNKFGFVLNRAALIALAVMLLCGWVFVRNAILYDGDFLGMSTQRKCAELYAQLGHDVYIPISPQSQGYSIIDMLFGMQWVVSTLKSYVAVFGYMNILVDSVYYFLYYITLLLGIFFALVDVMVHRRGRFEALLLVAAVAIPTVLSLYRSYTYDFQPQGRYLLPSLPAVAIMATYGFERFTLKVRDFSCSGAVRKARVYFDSSVAICALWILMYMSIYATVIVPELVLRY